MQSTLCVTIRALLYVIAYNIIGLIFETLKKIPLRLYEMYKTDQAGECWTCEESRVIISDLPMQH